MEIGRFEVGKIENGLRSIIAVTKDYKTAYKYYKEAVSEANIKNTNNQIILFVFDYDKNVNVEYYDSYTDKS